MAKENIEIRDTRIMKVKRSLKKLKNSFADPKKQIAILNNGLFNYKHGHQLVKTNNHQPSTIKLPRFEQKLKEIGLFPLKPIQTEILQVNIGYMCNLTCSHCHVNAGPDRKEIMTKETMQYCIEALKKVSSIQTVDLTGGSPEMNPDFLWFIKEISNLKRKTIVRSNLTILVANKKFRQFPEFFLKHKLIVIASLPCYTAENTNKQRGKGVFLKSIEALKNLNDLGYGKEETGLELHLVHNPLGPFLPPDQKILEDDYKKILSAQYGIVFNNLYTITNLPINRFLEYLIINKKYESYMETLINAFNPSAAINVMCRNTLSVSWDGKLYDCDFNQMLGMQIENRYYGHIKDFDSKQLQNRHIMLGQHCYGCTAGTGSSCQGALTT